MRKTRTAIAGMIMILVAACAPAGISSRHAANTAYPFAADLECNGTEPFWILSLTPGRGEFQPMEGEARTFTLALPLLAAGQTKAWILQGQDKSDDKPVRIELQHTGQCSDGMSDFNYDYNITLSQDGGQALAGCCGRQQRLPARNP